VPANLTEQWEDLLQDDTNEDGNPYFGLEIDGTHLDVMSISKFQNLTYDEVQDIKDAFDVVLVDEAHRFRNHGKWRPNRMTKTITRELVGMRTCVSSAGRR